MGVLMEALRAKFATQEPPLELEAGIRQETDLDAKTELAFATVEEMDKHIHELLKAREGEALMALSGGRFNFPAPEAEWPIAWPTRTPEQRQEMAGFQISTAAEAVQKAVMGDLFLKASKRNPEKYGARAFFYLGDRTTGRKGDWEITLDKVINSIAGMGVIPVVERPPSNVLQTSVATPGTRTAPPEYRRADGTRWGTEEATYREFDYRRPMS